MTTLRLYFALWNGHRQKSSTFHIQILYNKFILHTLHILFTLHALFTDLYRRRSFHRSYRTTAHEIRHPSIWRHYAPFYASPLHVQTCQIKKTNRSRKKPVWRAILFQNAVTISGRKELGRWNAPTRSLVKVWCGVGLELVRLSALDPLSVQGKWHRLAGGRFGFIALYL